VASRLGVSKWTGYDMMQELLSDGLVRASYSTASSGFRGRSQVLFEPTQEGLELLQLDAGAGVDGTVGTSARADSADVQGEWGETSESLLRRARAALESKSDLKSILAGFRDASPLSFCAALLAVLVVESRRSGLSLLTAEAVLEAGAEALSRPFRTETGRSSASSRRRPGWRTMPKAFWPISPVQS